ncbi:MAG: tetratricopeptide repeat protein [Ectothiorhodospiraceae bacterium]|jgi:tetratricopeptide (TPR) repeat protein
MNARHMIKDLPVGASGRWLPVLLLCLSLLGSLSGCATVDSYSRDVLGQRAAAAYDAGRFDDAATGYRLYLKHFPDDARAWYRLGNSYAELDRLRDAEAAYYRALKIDGTLARARHNLGLVHMQLAWKNLLEARRSLPEADQAAAETMQYLGCLMETFMGYPDPELCQGSEPETKQGDSND